MSKLTPFGKAVRKHRIDAGLLLKDLAGQVGRSPAFLSAVETGEKAIPGGLIHDVANALGLNDAQLEDLRVAAEQSQRVFQIQVPEDASPMERSVAAMFARRFNNLPEVDLKALHNILVNDKDKK
ncbi:helix-turn-helix transcriptional regulator [Dongia soli]|uniref:Helix-turn-helix transcriptional regulator n=1 Tax=Dongia soli TaxID=600628 RepID=A0ABU5E826_9PROT|nr:helix-turn-helix transcriptional regulator [Dongia soli]MDY0882341.1 helix-turn-helix transcriptional regulator [Dongia soli]